MRARTFKRVAIAVLWPLTVGSAWGLGFHMGLAWYLFDMRSLKQVSWTEMSTLCFRDPNEEFWLGCRDVREVVEVMAAHGASPSASFAVTRSSSPGRAHAFGQPRERTTSGHFPPSAYSRSIFP